jgi:hypothetical protein
MEKLPINQWEYTWINERPSDDDFTVKERLNTYGEAGWELVTVAISPTTDKCAFFLKRLIQPKSLIHRSADSVSQTQRE